MYAIYQKGMKRFIDIIVSCLLLVLFSPLLLMTYLAVRLTSAGSVFYTQERVGYREGRFTIYKFRSMRINYQHDPTKQVYSGDSAITPVGHLIRRFKIDELPQLWNVFRGDMTLVGPRPTLPEHLEIYTTEQRRRYDVVPGITGWAQVNGNVQLPLDERVAHDLWYIEHLSFWLDLKILLLTIKVVLFGEKVRE